jgi:type I restriction enzyme R subunit
MTKLTELKIEEFAIDLLKDQGYEHIYAPSIAPNSDNPLRNSFDDVLLESQLRSAINRINPHIDQGIQGEVLGRVKRVQSSELVSGNETFHSMMIEGVNIITRKNGEDRGDYIKLIDFDNPDNNEFSVVNQFTVTCNNQKKRPDIFSLSMEYHL